MKRPTWLPLRRWPARLRPAATGLAIVVAPCDAPGEARDRDLLGAAVDALDDQLHDVVDRNADGVNRCAIDVRRDTDFLLALGIADPFAARAGSYAQTALALANAGRGTGPQARTGRPTPQERADLVARAMTLVLRAEMLMAAARKNNRASIEAALDRQEQRIRAARAALLCAPAGEMP
jgi:hypothetical protein